MSNLMRSLRGSLSPIINSIRPSRIKMQKFLGHPDFGDFNSIKPQSNIFGFDRGLPIDRYYIESFLNENRKDIAGNVLEIGDRNYSNKFGGTFVTKSDVLHVSEGNPEATLIGDLETGRNIPANVFDCMILTQTFSFIYDAKSAIRHCYQALKPGGILLATFLGISQISRYDMDRWGEFWRFTLFQRIVYLAKFFNLRTLK
jgi:hypothetical protein